MDVVIPHDTVLESLTELPIQFAVRVDGLTIPSLKPGGKQLVNSSEILKISRRLESESWPIEVFIDEQLWGLKLETKHFLDHGLITFKFQRFENGKYLLVAEGVKEKKFIDTFLRMGRGIGNLAQRNRIWKKRNFEVIAKAPPEYARTLAQMRKPQAEFNISQDSVKHKEVNPSKRKNSLVGKTFMRCQTPVLERSIHTIITRKEETSESGRKQNGTGP